MEGHKDISDMSFEEFFSEKDRMPVPAPEPRRQQRQGRSGGDVQTGFGGASPKINYKDGRFLLYIPRYTSDENARFEVAVDCDEGVIPLGRLDSVPRGGARITRSATLDITSAGVSPLKPFTLLIDGQDAYRHKPRGLLFFNNIGLPVGRPVGETYIVHAKGTSLRTVKTEITGTTEVGDAVVSKAEVSVAGGVWLDDRKRSERAEAAPQAKSEPEAVKAEPAEAPTPESVPAEEPKKPKAAKRKKAKGSLKVPAGLQDAEASVDGVRLQIHRRFPAFTVSVENCDLDECTVSLLDANGEKVAGGEAPKAAPMTFDTEADGVLEIVLAKGEQRLASERFVYIPDFECSRPGKGDIPSDPKFTFTAFGETVDADIFDGPYRTERGGTEIALVWNTPAVTYDIGAGPVRFTEPATVDVGDLGDTLVVTVTGAKKKALFLGGDKGKKRDVTPDWTDDTYRVPMEQVREEIYASSAPEFTLFITVNSFPMRRFMTIRNPPRMSARFEDGQVVVEAQTGDYVCRIYRMDKSVEEVQLQAGENRVAVPEDAVEAEVAEVRGGKDRSSTIVQVRHLPFLWRDETGEYWLYVNRFKRIPLPGDLVASGKPDAARIRAWHDQILRMNPELREVTTPMMQKAFDDMAW